MLASDVSKSVIVSHAFPSQSEVCLICGQLVQYNLTEPSIVDAMPTYVNGSSPHLSTPSTSRSMLPSQALPPPAQFPEASSTRRVPYPILIPHYLPQNSHMLDYRRQHPNGIHNGAPNGALNGVINGVWSESPVDYMNIFSQVQPQPYHPPNVHDSLMVQDPTRQQESHSDVDNYQATLPKLVSISSPADPSYAWAYNNNSINSLRSGPLSPAMLAGPQPSTEQPHISFDPSTFRTGLTPRTGLTQEQALLQELVSLL